MGQPGALGAAACWVRGQPPGAGGAVSPSRQAGGRLAGLTSRQAGGWDRAPGQAVTGGHHRLCRQIGLLLLERRERLLLLLTGRLLLLLLLLQGELGLQLLLLHRLAELWLRLRAREALHRRREPGGRLLRLLAGRLRLLLRLEAPRLLEVVLVGPGRSRSGAREAGRRGAHLRPRRRSGLRVDGRLGAVRAAHERGGQAEGGAARLRVGRRVGVSAGRWLRQARLAARVAGEGARLAAERAGLGRQRRRLAGEDAAAGPADAAGARLRRRALLLHHERVVLADATSGHHRELAGHLCSADWVGIHHSPR